MSLTSLTSIDGHYYYRNQDGSMREVFPFNFVKHKIDYNAKEFWGVEFSPMDVMQVYGNHLEVMILEEVASRVADEIIKQHLPAIIAGLDQQAIANMTIAAAGAKVNETLNKKMPDKILEIHHETSSNKGKNPFW